MRVIYTFALLPLVLFSAAAPLLATEPASRSLEAGWEFRAVRGTDRTELKAWHPAQVPGVVHTDLLRQGLIPDPFNRDNDSRLQWIGLADWEYRTSFQADKATLGREHVELVFDGLDTLADVYLNDKPVLHADNMFRRWRIAAKSLLQPGANTLRVVFHSPITEMLPQVKALPYDLPSVTARISTNEENIATAPYTRKAPYQYGWDWGPRYVTEGIWLPVRLEMWDSLRIEDFHIQQDRVTKDSASVTAQVELNAGKDTAATLTFSYEDASGRMTKAGIQTAELRAGANHIAFPIQIAAPDLWYPSGYGRQNRYRFFVAVQLGPQTAARAEVKTGVRSIELRREADQWGRGFTFVVNGISIFAKGANVIPFDSFPTRVTAARQRQILEAARDAHMNMVRVWGGGHYQSDEFYDICDEMGILVWQDFMFGGDMVPGNTAYQENVRQEAIEQIKRLRDHPSMALWCGNNEAEMGWHDWPEYQAFKASVSPEVRERIWQDYVILFEDIIKSVVTQYAASVPYWPSSPSSNFEERPGNQRNGDMHSWSVWHALAPSETYTHDFPRFLSEYGFQSFPEMRTIRSFALPQDLDIRSATMQAHQKNTGGNERILSYMLREYCEPKDFASFVYLSQLQQAEVIKVGAEHLRRQRPRTMGSLYWQLNDCWPTASWSSIDYFGRWKALHYYARRFYDDVLVSPHAHDNEIDVYVVSDKIEPLMGKLHLKLQDFKGNTLFEQIKQLYIPAQSSAIYVSLDKRELLAKGDARRNYLTLNFEVDGQSVSRNILFFDVSRNLELPVAPRIETALVKRDDGYKLTLSSSELARAVVVSFGDLDVRMSDNYFDLLPGEPVSIRLSASSSLDELKSALKTMSLTEAFDGMETPSPSPVVQTSGN
jgi:beta-mannosidase